MAVLTKGRNTPQKTGDMRAAGVAAATTLHVGAMVMRNATGHLTRGATATGLVGVGRAEETTVNAGLAGDVLAKYRPGTFRFPATPASAMSPAWSMAGNSWSKPLQPLGIGLCWRPSTPASRATQRAVMSTRRYPWPADQRPDSPAVTPAEAAISSGRRRAAS